MRHHQGWFLAAAVLVMLRCSFVFMTREDPVFRVPYLDGAFYHAWAQSLATGKGDFTGPYFLGPLYPHTLRWLYALFGADPFVVRLAQTLLGCLTLGLLGWCGTRWFGVTAGLAAVILYGTSAAPVFYEGLLTMEVLLATLLLGAFVLVAKSPGNVWRMAGSGVLLGLATLGRGSVLLLAPLLWSATRRSGSSYKRALLPVVWALVLLPVVWRNASLGGGPVLTTNAGVNFHAGNSPGANGRFKQPPGVRFFVDATASQQALPSAVASRPLTVEAVAGSVDAASSRLWFARSWDWIRHEPLAFTVLILRKVGLTLQAHDIAQIESLDFHRRRLVPLRWFFVDLGWILPLAALGAWVAWRNRNREARFTLGFAITLLLPCVIFFVTGRYRLSALPFLTLLAGYGVASWWDWWRSRRRAQCGVALALVLVVAALTRVGAKATPSAPGWENAQMAERLYTLGDLDGTIAYQKEAARWLPNRLEVQMNLALYWSERNHAGDAEKAIQLLEALTRRWPENALVHFNLGTVYQAHGRTDAARGAYARALQLEPQMLQARRALEELRMAP